MNSRRGGTEALSYTIDRKVYVQKVGDYKISRFFALTFEIQYTMIRSNPLPEI